MHVFSGPGALPTLTELTDPPAWLARVGLPEGRAAATLPQRSSA
jgi:hypothetical protein